MYDIEHIGLEMRAKLKLKNIAFNDIDRYLIT